MLFEPKVDRWVHFLVHRALDMGLRAWIHALTAPSNSSIPIDDGQYKLVCIVNHSLKMGKGKIAAQVGHASVEACLKSIQKQPQIFEVWKRQGQRKVVVKAIDADEIEAILLAANDAGLATTRIRDAGKTQIPSGSLTVGAIGPAIESELDELTGHLKLL